ncbi:outer membrane lipoprotein-sorting protein [candidate division KSB3 bacterium]|uniref:Outer membrane lipoprotein-sorting protein n=1 Tax=candidate division KSB3 bacterium TaxID=2044937 RepID=A0A9D5JS42_9BACT|nr:outer membrane lipoprotein-sorting protein [candidate division KSB3 bacterium]MBD3323110.1 outer membrane lipoprotein-sorting protein [candidate division KSB3 bacterium]
MKYRRQTIGVLLLVCMLGGVTTTLWAEQDHVQIQEQLDKGRTIIEEAEQRAEFDAEQTILTMTLHYANGKQRTRHLEIFTKYDEDGNRKNLIRFTGPNDVKNTALLTLEGEKGNDDQWLYLPILRKSKRIAAGAKTRSFAGTDYTFEDLRPEALDRHDYLYTEDQEIDGQPCFVILATPTPEEEPYTGYGKRLIFIRQDNYFPIETRYYDKNETLLKKYTHAELINIGGKTWRADTSVMENVQEKTKTVRVVDERLLPDTLDDMLFTQHELTREY